MLREGREMLGMKQVPSLVFLLQILVAACFYTSVFAQSSNSGYAKYNPCAPATPLNKGELFVIGLAFWPGGKIADWGPPGNDSRGYPGLNPCLGDVSINGSYTNYNQYLTSKNVYFSTYGIGVDTMTALRSTKVEEDQLYDYVTTLSGVEQVVSVIAFRGNVRSPAQYIRSNSGITGGTGVVRGIGIIVTMQGGIVTALEWYNFDGCSPCGGIGGANCISSPADPPNLNTTQQSCAVPLTDKDCTCRGVDKCKTANCTTTYLTSFRGNSKSGQPLQSSYQITTANKYSISNTFTNFFSQVGNDLGNVNAGPIGAGVSSGTTASPLPLPSGAQTDAALADAQNGIAASPSPSPEAVVAAPTTDPAAATPTDPAAATTTPADPAAATTTTTDPAAAATTTPTDPAAAATTTPTDPAAATTTTTDPAAATTDPALGR